MRARYGVTNRMVRGPLGYRWAFFYPNGEEIAGGYAGAACALRSLAVLS